MDDRPGVIILIVHKSIIAYISNIRLALIVADSILFLIFCCIQNYYHDAACLCLFICFIIFPPPPIFDVSYTAQYKLNNILGRGHSYNFPVQGHWRTSQTAGKLRVHIRVYGNIISV